jgi:hypothetical protein
MTQTVDTPLVGRENVAGLKLISCNSTHFVTGKYCRFNAHFLAVI